MTNLEAYLIAMRERDGTIESAQHLDDLWFKLSAEERQQAHRELQMRPGLYLEPSTPPFVHPFDLMHPWGN